MYVRLVFVKVKKRKMDEFRNLYLEEVIPIVTKHNGNRFVHLLENRENENEAISVTAWDKKENFEAYVRSGDFARTSEKYSPIFSENPVEKSYEVTASSDPLILRIF